MENTLIEKQLKAAADLNRIKLLACMKNGEVCVCDFVDVLGISQPAISQYLRKLKGDRHYYGTKSRYLETLSFIRGSNATDEGNLRTNSAFKQVQL